MTGRSTEALSVRFMRSLLSHKKPAPFEVWGTSMEPRLHAGDKVFIEPVKPTEVAEGDLILYRKKSLFVLHRLIYRKNGLMIMKGDGNRYADSPVYGRQIMGRVRSRKSADARPERAALGRLAVFARQLDKCKLRYCLAGGLPYALLYRTMPRMDRFECTVLVAEHGFTRARTVLSGLGYRKEVPPVHVPLQMMSQTREIWQGTPVHGIPFVVILACEPTVISRYRFLQSLLYSRPLLIRMANEALSQARGVRIRGFRFLFPAPRMRMLLAAVDFLHHNMRGSHRYMLLRSMFRLHMRGTAEIGGLKRTVDGYGLGRTLDNLFHRSFYEKPPLAVFSETSWLAGMGERMLRFAKMRFMRRS